MSTFSNTPPLPQPAPLNTSVASGAAGVESKGGNIGTTGVATTAARINAGAVATVLAATSSQLTLSTGNGKVSLPATKLPAVLDVGKDVAVRISTPTSPTGPLHTAASISNPASTTYDSKTYNNPILEVAAKYSQQRLTLTPQQSQQILQTVVQSPNSISGSLEIKGKVVSVQQNQIQVSVNGKTVNLSVRNPQQYQPGQDIKLGLSAGTLGWEANVQNDSIKESFRLPMEESRKILSSLRPGQSFELSEKGKQLVRPILRENSSSQLPSTLNKVSLSNTDGRIVAQLDIGNAAIAKIPINNTTLQTLSNVELRSTSGGPSFKENSLQSDVKRLLSNPTKTNVDAASNALSIGKSDFQPGLASKATGDSETAHVYKNPISNTVNSTTATKSAGVENVSGPNLTQNKEVSPDIAKTIKISQEQFSEIEVKFKPAAQPVVNEIKLSEQKADRPTVNPSGAAPRTNENTKSNVKSTESLLSNSAQQILNTLKSLNTESAADVKQTMVQNLSRILDSINQAGKSNGNLQATDVLKLLRQVSEKTAASGEVKAVANGSSSKGELLKAVDELIDNKAIDQNIKSHVKQAISQVRPEQANLPIPDMHGVKQLLQSAALPLTPLSIVTPTPSAGLVAGLVNLLQVSLAARLNKGNQQLQDKISHSLTNIVTANARPQTAVKSGPQNIRELSNLEQKHNMVKMLSDMVNQHSQQKIQNAERNLQGQEGMYYVLPFGTADDQKPAELLVQRDKPDQERNIKEGAQTSAWQLTMKLPVGELGEILTKSKVTEESITVDLYTSSEELKNLTMNYLPLLKRRFDALGLKLEIGRCERGNIPEQLAKNPYQILETRV